MPGFIAVTSDHQTGPIYDPADHPPGDTPVFVNQSATVDVYLDRDDPRLLNQTAPNQTPTAGTKLAKAGGQITFPSGRKIFARCDGATAASSSIQLL